MQGLDVSKTIMSKKSVDKYELRNSALGLLRTSSTSASLPVHRSRADRAAFEQCSCSSV